MLYEALSGKPPFKGRTQLEVAAAVLKETPAPLPTHTPKEFARVVGRCLRKEPKQRYQRVSEVLAALEVIRPLHGTATTETAITLESDTVVAPRSMVVTPGKIGSLVVLPLSNLTRDPEQEYFSDGMTEMLITILAQIGALRVISKTTAMQYRGSIKSLPEIGQELQVDAVVEGSVARIGNQVRINAQLVHAQTDTHLWAASYTRELQDIFALQTEVANRIAQEVHVKLTPEERDVLAHAEPVNPEAHKAYLRGRHCRNLITGAGFEKAIQFCEDALAIDPDHARAHSLLGETYVLQGMYGFTRPRDVLPLAKRATAKAMAIDDSLAEAHSTWAWAIQIMDLDRRGCEREYERALQLNPGHETTLMRYGA